MPDLAFSDADLRHATPELTALGLPKPVSGSFASVYQLHTKVGQQWAVRCFLRNVPNQEQRYAHISEHLQHHRFEFMVPFEFIRRGILVSGNWFPILKMQWVSGTPLIEWVQKHVDDIHALGALQNSFSEMCRALIEHDIAHGDLQHGNILIVDGKPKLVDYDGLYVPALHAMGSAELGHRHYQHPRRSSADFGTYLDNFSAWVIWTSLHCIAQDARLWRKLGCGEECLLFRQEDYVNPSRSVAFAYLEQHESEVIREASRTMRRLLALDPKDVPPLGEPIVGGQDTLEIMPPLAVPGVSLEAEGVMSNLRAAVAAAAAPTLVATKPQIRLVEVPDQAAAQQAAQNISPWYLQPGAQEYLNIPVRPRPAAPPAAPKGTTAKSAQNSKVNGIRNRLAFIFGILMLFSIFKTASHAPSVVSNPSAATTPVYSTHVDRAAGTYAIVDDLSQPLSAKLAPDSEAVVTYKQAYQVWKTNPSLAYAEFAHAKTLNWQVDIDKALCEYMMAQCVALQKGSPSEIIPLLESAESQCNKYKFWIPDLAIQLSQQQLNLNQSDAAAKTLLEDLKFGSPSMRAQKLALLRKAALQAMGNASPPALYWYTQFVNSVPMNEKVPFNVFQDLRNEIRINLKAGKKAYAIEIAKIGKQFMQRSGFAVDPRCKIFEQEFDKAIELLNKG
jgi:hypothetical protein